MLGGCCVAPKLIKPSWSLNQKFNSKEIEKHGIGVGQAEM